MPHGASSDGGPVRAAEVVAALSLATDLGIAVPVEHGLHSTLFALRLCDRLGVDVPTTMQTYYICLLFHVGCTATAQVAAELFGEDDALTTYATASRFGSRPQVMAGMARAVAPPSGGRLLRAGQLARGMPKLVRAYPGVMATLCEVGRMLAASLGLPGSVSGLFASIGERWDGKGEPGLAAGNDIPLPVRIAHVARDAAFQQLLEGQQQAARVIGQRAGAAFDPVVARRLADDAAQILTVNHDDSVWQEILDREPAPQVMLEGAAIERALEAVADFADLASPYLVGHSTGVARLVASAAQRRGADPAAITALRHAALVHDLGRVAVPTRIWHKQARLSADDWEQVRLHAYHSERVLSRSPFLAALTPVATFHHERLDGSGYHRGTSAGALPWPARLLAAADGYHAMTEPRPQRTALSSKAAAAALTADAQAGRLDPDAVVAVLEAAGQPTSPVDRPAGLTEREAEVVGLLARGLQTKQVARRLEISVKTADHHVQNAYRKMGVSTRAAAALFAMQHGLVAWGELPMGAAGRRS